MFVFAKNLLNARYSFWLLLFLPAPPLLADLVERNRYYAEIMYESGVLATQLTVLALAITPLIRLLRAWPAANVILRWFQRRRRSVGVAAFGYSALHAVFYIRHVGSAELIWLDLEELPFASGWIAFAFLAVAALTSNDWSVRRLGRWWKRLQTAAYLAALSTFLHWWIIDQFLNQMMFWLVPLIALQMPRLFIRVRSKSTPA